MAKVTLNELKQTFARRLKAARLICGLSQAELVAKMKELAEDFPALYKSVSSTAVERYEKEIMFPVHSEQMEDIMVKVIHRKTYFLFLLKKGG